MSYSNKFYEKTVTLPTVLKKILDDLLEIRVNPVLVGGFVRDFFLNIPNKDFDVELFGLNDLNAIESVLSKYGSVKSVGKSFGVLILSVDGYDFDFALPRIEKKIGKNHTDFEVFSDANLSFKKAALRRDFTINSIGYEYKTHKFLDPYNGIKDIENKILRHIDDNTFVEDSLRVYRAVQFVSRFDLKIDDKTLFLCQKIVENNECENLAKERIFEEFKKLFLKSPKPSIGLELLKEIGLLRYFKELEDLVGCIQDKIWHPEGDVWIHTLMCVDELAKIIQKEKIEDEYRKLYLFYGILCHDLGKPYCTKEINGHITSYKHESLGIEPTIGFLEKLTNEKKFVDIVCTLVKNHLAPFSLYKTQSSQKAIKRLSLKVNIEDLSLVCLADCLGRDIPDKQKCYKATSWLLEEAKKLEIHNEPIKPLVQGRDLINLGLKPSKEFKTILDFAFDLQIDKNLLREDIIKEIKNYLSSINT